jgi:pimeloyl-ACP methyl ester carboxylesterase
MRHAAWTVRGRSRPTAIAKAALIGSSVGGMTAIELAARAPERVAPRDRKLELDLLAERTPARPA